MNLEGEVRNPSKENEDADVVRREEEREEQE